MLDELEKVQLIINNYQQVNEGKLGRIASETNDLAIDRSIVENSLDLLSGFDLSGRIT